jgi:Zn-dependent oligopeptidase
VLAGTLQIYQDLLGLKFVQVTGVAVWHPEVQTYEVYDKSSNDLIGHFYMDLFPREGKYTHAAAFPLQKGCVLANGEWQLPASAMVCNFAKPLPGTPSLLKHDEVETFFHEFGHIMHGICAKAKYARFAGTSTERDFVECPSQMLENWCWDKEILRKISCHHKTGEPLPDALLDKMIAAKNVNSGLLNLRQVFYGVFDQTAHTSEHIDSAKLYNTLRAEITKTAPQPQTNGAASFGHLVGGYDASYYGYLWSKVFSADLFEQFSQKGVMSAELGKRYREMILQPGGSKDGDEMLRDFLGRDPIMQPFVRSIGLE